MSNFFGKNKHDIYCKHSKLLDTMKTEATGADKHWVQEMFNNKTVSYELHNRNFVLYLMGFFSSRKRPVRVASVEKVL